MISQSEPPEQKKTLDPNQKIKKSMNVLGIQMAKTKRLFVFQVFQIHDCDIIINPLQQGRCLKKDQAARQVFDQPQRPSVQLAHGEKGTGQGRCLAKDQANARQVLDQGKAGERPGLEFTLSLRQGAPRLELSCVRALERAREQANSV